MATETIEYFVSVRQGLNVAGLFCYDEEGEPVRDQKGVHKREPSTYYPPCSKIDPEKLAPGELDKLIAAKVVGEGAPPTARTMKISAEPLHTPGNEATMEGDNPNGIPETERSRKEREKRELAKPKSPWSFHPSELEGKDIHELNRMILERAPNGDPVAELEEAIAVLTRDCPGLDRETEE